jgi:hypothetical protein
MLLYTLYVRWHPPNQWTVHLMVFNLN